MTCHGGVRFCLKSRALALGLAVALALGGALAPRPAQAMSRDVKTMLVIGGYGVLGGTVLGAAALPFNQDLRTLFIGSSLGLYLGIAVGLYYIHDRHQRESRSGRRQAEDRPIENRGAPRVEEELRLLASARPISGLEAAPALLAPARVDVAVLRF